MGTMTTTPEKRRATVTRYRRKYPERTRTRGTKEESQRDPVKRTWKAYRANAKYRGQLYALPRELHNDLVTDACFYCGELAKPVNGIDRVDNARGYVEDNVVTACFRCNSSKSSGDQSDFIGWVKNASEHMTRTGLLQAVK